LRLGIFNFRVVLHAVPRAPSPKGGAIRIEVTGQADRLQLSVVNDGQPLNQALRAVLGIRFPGGDRRALVRLSGCVELEASRGVTPRLKTPSRLK
jgi:hypothetical protein